jgi:hypothetical protein
MAENSNLAALQVLLEGLRAENDVDYLIVAVGVRGPNYDCPEGNAVATVEMGNDRATSEAVHLRDAIALAKGKIRREREAKIKKGKANG